MMIRTLTSRFINDIRNLNLSSLLLLFDAVDNANDSTRDWLINTFLVQISHLDNVRIVLAGRQVPEPPGSYSEICHTYELLPIQDDQAYIAYCREIGLSGETLSDQSIRDIAKVLDYNPGLFCDRVLSKYAGDM